MSLDAKGGAEAHLVHHLMSYGAGLIDDDDDAGDGDAESTGDEDEGNIGGADSGRGA